jgi:hypothetical protein
VCIIFVYKLLLIVGNNFVLPEILLLIELDWIRMHTKSCFQEREMTPQILWYFELTWGSRPYGSSEPRPYGRAPCAPGILN